MLSGFIISTAKRVVKHFDCSRFFLGTLLLFSVAFLPVVETELSALRLLLVPCGSICLYAFRTVFTAFLYFVFNKCRCFYRKFTLCGSTFWVNERQKADALDFHNSLLTVYQ